MDSAIAAKIREWLYLAGFAALCLLLITMWLCAGLLLGFPEDVEIESGLD